MKLLSLLAAATVATAAALPNPFSPIPGYPLGLICLSDAQANFFIKNFVGLLTNPDRQKTNAGAQLAIAEGFTEASDSINILEGLPLGTASLANKAAYIASLTAAPPIPSFSTIDIFHDCNKISWRWNIPNFAAGIYPVMGINNFQVDPKSGQIKSNYLEFNSIAWGVDVGWTCTAPPP